MLTNYFLYGSLGGLIFLVWLFHTSSKVRGEGQTRNRAIVIGAVSLFILIVPDIWALTQLKGVSLKVAGTVGLLFIHIIEGGIWHRICWGEKCPKCGAWVNVEDEPVPDSETVVRRTATCAKCGWTDSWSMTLKKALKINPPKKNFRDFSK